ncbi:MAG: sulfite exporter TauE/SafE family protein [Planctomycetota bacterium]|nr:sulfite exporter TauE/SafE family protein [Planctomycetota bacterium]
MWLLSILFGTIVGLSLGLTGGGGSIFAVPLLVYGLDVPMREAVGISLAAVGATSFFGFISRWRTGDVELRTGLLFAVAGMIGAPVGSWLSGLIPESILLVLFAGLMIVVAVRMWKKASIPHTAQADCPIPDQSDAPTCQRDAAGALILTSRCAKLLLLVGVITGILSGMFGVGGGFVIVPALVLFSGMSIYRAVGTSLMVISLVSISGVSSHLLAGREIPFVMTSLFVVGGIAGLLAGNLVGRQLSGPVLQKIFVVAILVVAAFIIIRSTTA